jgi:hypothetical protein
MCRKTDQEASFIIFLLLIIGVIIYFIVTWIIQNWILVFSGIIIIGAIIGVYYFIKFQKEKQEKEEKNKLSAERTRLWEEEQIKLTAEREKFEVEQKEKGLIKFLDRVIMKNGALLRKLKNGKKMMKSLKLKTC